MTDYIICTTARSGSNLLCDVLRNTGILGHPVEGFNPDFMRTGAYKEFLSSDLTVSSSHFIEWIRKRHRTSNGVFGTKILFEDFEKFRGFPDFREFFLNSRIIHLRRRSKLRQAISYFFAQETGQWVATDIARKPLESIVYDHAAIRKHLHRLVRQDAAWTATLDALGISYQEVIFEHFIADMRSTIEQIASGIGLSAENLAVTATLAEQKNALTAEFVERFRADLRETEFAPTGPVNYKGIDFT